MPLEYVRSKNWEHKLHSDQINLRVCPKCNDTKWHFYIAKESSGLWKCHKCNETGNLYQLKKSLGDIENAIHPASRKKEFRKPDVEVAKAYHDAIFSDYDALKYLNDRGITADTVRRYRLGVRNRDEERWLSIPHIEGRELVNIKYRRLPPHEKMFEREFNCKSVLFNGNAVEKNHSIIIVEGELDAITLLQNGFENVVSVTNGADSFDSDWVKKLEPLNKIFICYDADEAGQKGAIKVAKRLGYGRCWNVILPVKDANDFFLVKTADDFKAILDKSKQFSLPGVITARDALDLLRIEMESGRDQRGIDTRWDNVNRITSGWKPGDLIILSAVPKTGKTTWALDITWSNVLKNIPSLFFCLEMRTERLIRKLIQHQYRIDNPTLENLHSFQNLLGTVPLYFGVPKRYDKADDLINTIYDSVKMFGIEFVVFDNLHILCRDDNEKLAKASLGLKLMAEELEIPVMVIAQPRKRENSNTDIMCAEDVKYTSSIHADCDQMIILHRNRKASKAKDIGKGLTLIEESMDPVTLVRVEAHRYGPGGETLLYYVGEHSRFEQLDRKDTVKIVGKDKPSEHRQRKDIHG